MQVQRKTLTQLSIPICFETLFYMLAGMVDTLMLSSVSDQAVGAVGTANTYPFSSSCLVSSQAVWLLS